MSVIDRLTRAGRAFLDDGRPAVSLNGPPTAPIQATGNRTRDAIKRRRNGGRISPPSLKEIRWLRKDIEDAEHDCRSGNVRHAAQIGAWVRGDLLVGGLLSTRCSVPRLPRTWRGNEEARNWLEGHGKKPGIFDTLLPPVELEELAIDNFVNGFGVGCFIRPPGCKYIKLVRLDPQWLNFRLSENRWVYQGYSQLYHVEPGNGTWFLITNGHIDPWYRGTWADLGRDQCSEDQAGLNRDAFIGKYSNPFVVAQAAQGQSDEQKFIGWKTLQKWTMGFLGVVGSYKVDILQPKAEGREVISDAEGKTERRAMMRICGQVVTSLGGPGFANAEVFATIASHLVARTGQDLAAPLNEQCIGQIISMGIEEGWIEDDSPLLLGYDTTPPQARKAEADAITAAMTAFLKQWEAADKANDPRMRPDPEEYRARFRLPVASDPIEAAHATIRALSADERQVLYGQIREEVYTATSGAVPIADAANDTDPKETLNGAQIDSAVSIVSAVASGLLPRDAGIAQLEILLNLTNDQATRMMGSAGAGFTPTVDGEPPKPLVPNNAPPLPTLAAVVPPEEPEEPGYSEKLAASMTARGDTSCPCDRQEAKFCPRCRVVRRYEAPEDPTQPYRAVWHPVVRKAAA